MRKQKKKDSGPGNDWMNTYADMVTLLMCFFVLLFSISTLDAEKWQIVVRSLNPEQNVSQIVMEELPDELGEESVGQASDGNLTDIEEFDQVYWSMKQFVEENELEEVIEVKKGKDFTFIVFRNNIFFDGDSYTLRDEGKEVLDYLVGAIEPVADQVAEMKVMGHTNQADPNQPNSVDGDRFLSSNRATEVLVYIQEQGVLEGNVLQSIGYGQHYPVASFITEEDRALNRRVEIFIAQTGAEYGTLDEIYDNIEPEPQPLVDESGESIVIREEEV